MSEDFDFGEFLCECKDITTEIIDLYDELLDMEVKGDLNSQNYNNKVLELKEKVKEERDFYVSSYELISDKWYDLEEAVREELFKNIESDCKDEWLNEDNARYKTMDYKLEKRIFKNIYLNVYKFMNEKIYEEDIEQLQKINLEIFDSDVFDLSICDDLNNDYLNIFIYLLGKFLNKNINYLSLENLRSLLEIRYDLAFVDSNFEDELINNLFKWPDEVLLQVHLKAVTKSQDMVLESSNNNKTILFLKYWKKYEKDIQRESIKNLEYHLKKIADCFDPDNYTKMIDFLYLKSIVCSSINENKDLVMSKLNEYKGKNYLLDMYIKSLLKYDYREDKVYKLSLFKN